MRGFRRFRARRALGGPEQPDGRRVPPRPREPGPGYAGAMAGMHQHYTCRKCRYAGVAEAPANAADAILLEAAKTDHAEHSPDCSEPSLQLGALTSGD